MADIMTYMIDVDHEDVVFINRVLMALVIFALLVVGWEINKRVKHRNQISETMQNIITASTKIKNFFNDESRYNFSGDVFSAQNQVKAGIWPEEYLHGTKLINNWGGEITLTQTDADGNENISKGGSQGFAITFTNLPFDACVETASFGTDWSAVLVNKKKYLRSNGDVPPNMKELYYVVCEESANTVAWVTK